MRKRSAEHESPSPRRSACQARMASATPHCVFSPTNLFLEHRTFASAVRRLGDGYGFRRCRELFAEEQRTGCDRVDCSGCADGNAGPSNGSNRADPDSSEKGEEASANDRHLRE